MFNFQKQEAELSPFILQTVGDIIPKPTILPNIFFLLPTSYFDAFGVRGYGSKMRK